MGAKMAPQWWPNDALDTILTPSDPQGGPKRWKSWKRVPITTCDPTPGEPVGSQNGKKFRVQTWKNVKNGSEKASGKRLQFSKDFVSILVAFVKPWEWKKQSKLRNCLQFQCFGLLELICIPGFIFGARDLQNEGKMKATTAQNQPKDIKMVSKRVLKKIIKKQTKKEQRGLPSNSENVRFGPLKKQQFST